MLLISPSGTPTFNTLHHLDRRFRYEVQFSLQWLLAFWTKNQATMTRNHACPVTLLMHKANRLMDLCSHVIHYFEGLADGPAASLGMAYICPHENLLCGLNTKKTTPLSILILFFFLMKASSHFNRAFSSFPNLTRNLEIGFMFSGNRMFCVLDFLFCFL